MTHGVPEIDPAPLRHHPLLPLRPQRPPRPGPLRRALQQDLRHRAPPRAVGLGAQPPVRAVPRAHRGARRGLLPGRRVGAPALVRVQRAARRALRRRGPPARVGRALVVAHHERRAPRPAGAGRHDRPRAVRDLRHQRAGRARLPPAHRPSTAATSPSAARCTRRCSTPPAASAPTSRSCASASDDFRVVTGAFDGPRDEHWFRRHLPDDGSVTFVDNTSALCTIGVWGPNARGPDRRRHRRRHLRRGASPTARRRRC